MGVTVQYPIEWGFPHEQKCSRARFVAKLRELAAHWQGWETFAWYLTRTLHRHIDGPPTDWDHLQTLFWIRGFAAHVILTARFENRNAVLDMLVRNRVEFVGMLRHIIVDQIRWCLIFTKQARLHDCALWGADTEENRQAVEEKRAEFRDGIEHAVAEFVRVGPLVEELVVTPREAELGDMAYDPVGAPSAEPVGGSNRDILVKEDAERRVRHVPEPALRR